MAGALAARRGVSLPSVAVGLLGLVMTPAQASALPVVPSPATNIWQLDVGPTSLPLVPRLWPMLLCFCIGT